MAAKDTARIPLIRSLRVLDDHSVELRAETGLEISHITRDGGLFDDRHAYDTQLQKEVLLPNARPPDQLRIELDEGCSVQTESFVGLKLIAIDHGKAVFDSTYADHRAPVTEIIRVAPYETD